jgi:hypothetical protein
VLRGAEGAVVDVVGADEENDAPSTWLGAAVSLLRVAGACTLVTFELGMTMGARVVAGAATGAAA